MTESFGVPDPDVVEKLKEIADLESKHSLFGVSFAVRGEWEGSACSVKTEDAVDYVIQALKRSAELSKSIDLLKLADRKSPK